MFRIIAGLLGYYFLGLVGAFIGYLLGSMADRFRAYGMGGVNPFSRAQRQSVFLDTVFILMGKLAKADGHISQGEIDHVEQFIQKLGMSSDHRKQAIALFGRGASPEFEIESSLNQFMTVCGQTHSLRQMLLVYLIVMALSDGGIHASEENLLRQIAQHLGYDSSAFQQMLNMILNQAHFAGGQSNSANALEDAYKALGVSKDSTDQEVKKAYRKLISQYHPDKLIGQGVPADMIAVATRQSQEVQVAYDLIEKSRKK